MTAEPDLLPLRDWMECLGEISAEDIRDYARANVAHATAAKNAEIEALRAEVAEAAKVLRRALDASTDGEPLRVLAIRASNALYWRTERAERAEASADRLEEAAPELLAALVELRDWYTEHTGLPAVAANAAIAKATGEAA